jgi:hypothetical protein
LYESVRALSCRAAGVPSGGCYRVHPLILLRWPN